MDELDNFVNDDENDTLLFKRLREHVLEHYPNPDRIGCLDHATLASFVQEPGKLDLKDPKYLHVFQCAECTRDLMELRQLRDQAFKEEPYFALHLSPPLWRFAGITAIALVCVILFGLIWRHHTGVSLETTRNDAPSTIFADLSADGLARGGDQSQTKKPIILPSQSITLHLVLPYFSPEGSYRITLSRNQTQDDILASGVASAAAHGSHSELVVQLNLRHLAPGNYNLGTTREGDGAPYYYPVVIRR